MLIAMLQELQRQVVNAPSGPWIIVLTGVQVTTLIAVGTLIWSAATRITRLTLAVEQLAKEDKRAVDLISENKSASKEDYEQCKADVQKCWDEYRALEDRVREAEFMLNIPRKRQLQHPPEV